MKEMNINKDELLEKAKELLKDEVTKISYNTWIQTLGIQSISNDHIVFTVTSDFQRDFIENKFKSLIFNTLRYITNKEWTYSVVEISEETKEHVRKVMEELGYQYKEVNKKPKTIGVVFLRRFVDAYENPIFLENIRGISYICNKSGYKVEVITGADYSEINKSMEIAAADGYIFLYANINQRLIENIFFKNSPLHDGAMIIRKKRIAAAGCILPVSHDGDIPKQFGLRHRAALGISQKTDALAIVVSEETGTISAAKNGSFHVNLTADELEAFISQK